MKRQLPRFGFLFLCFGLTILAANPEITKASYEKRSPNQGVVLVAVNWSRLWGVKGYENAELREISFDRVGTAKANSEKADIILEGPSGIISRIASRPVFINYAILVPAGRYVMSGFDVKVAESVSSILHIKPNRSVVIVDGNSKLGFFDVSPGEFVYIGNFFLDRAMEPFIWRYYSPRPASFDKHMAEFHSKYPFLPLDNVAYRLFETTTIGGAYLEAEKKPNKAPEPTPAAVTVPAGQEPRRP